MFEEVNVFFEQNEGFLEDANGTPYLPSYNYQGGGFVFLAPYPELFGNGRRKVLPIAVITTGGVVLKKP